MTPTREHVMPEPFGYVSDGFTDGLRFQHKPWPELHQLTHSVAAVHSAAQLLQAIADAHAAGRDQGLREAKEVCEAHKADYEFSQYRGSAAMSAGDCATAIEQLRGK